MQRKIILYGNDIISFFSSLDTKTKEKITYVIDIIKSTVMVPEKFLKHIEGTDGLYEIRIKSGSNIYRIFCCFDRGNLVILFNGFQKKDQKTPKNEILLAEKLRKEYLSSN
jgi:phage-related protein